MKKNLQEISDEELLKEAKKRKSFFAFYVGLIIVMIVGAIDSTVREGINTFTFIPFAFLGIALMFWSNYNKAQKELKSRNLK